jgi:hypothetical protein
MKAPPSSLGWRSFALATSSWGKDQVLFFGGASLLACCRRHGLLRRCGGAARRTAKPARAALHATPAPNPATLPRRALSPEVRICHPSHEPYPPMARSTTAMLPGWPYLTRGAGRPRDAKYSAVGASDARMPAATSATSATAGGGRGRCFDSDLWRLEQPPHPTAWGWVGAAAGPHAPRGGGAAPHGPVNARHAPLRPSITHQGIERGGADLAAPRPHQPAEHPGHPHWRCGWSKRRSRAAQGAPDGPGRSRCGWRAASCTRVLPTVSIRKSL